VIWYVPSFDDEKFLAAERRQPPDAAAIEVRPLGSVSEQVPEKRLLSDIVTVMLAITVPEEVVSLAVCAVGEKPVGIGGTGGGGA